MTREQAAANLTQIHNCAESFTLEFSGKKKRRANGSCFPASRKIVINDRNFPEGEAGDGRLFYTAMHELAHHIQHTEHGQTGDRSHTKLFYSLLDGLAGKAESLGLYRCGGDAEVEALIDEAAGISAEIAALQRKLGTVLNSLHGACLRKGVRYEDVLKRKVKISDRTEKKLVKIAATDVPAGTGFETQEAVAAAKSADQRTAMLAAAREGRSVNQVKQAGARQMAAAKEEPDELETLEKEKNRIKTTIECLNRRLQDVLRRIEKLEGG